MDCRSGAGLLSLQTSPVEGRGAGAAHTYSALTAFSFLSGWLTFSLYFSFVKSLLGGLSFPGHVI